MEVFFAIFLFLLLLFYNNKEYFQECSYGNIVLNKEQIQELNELLQTFINFSIGNNVSYFLIGGSLLGLERNGGLLPFDDDIDIGVLMNDDNKIKNYKNDKYYFEEIGFGYKFKKKDSNIFIDIMVYENIDGVYKIINNNWPIDYFKEDDLLPLKQGSYSNINVLVPNNYNDYLNRLYPEWDKKIKVDCGHYSEECIYDKYHIPKEFNVDYENNKYMCYTKLS
jgi:phosphorylcholine metabolism protein LicD